MFCHLSFCVEDKVFIPLAEESSPEEGLLLPAGSRTQVSLRGLNDPFF